MKKIPSFTIDHLRLLRGIYVSRKDPVGGEIVTTFDIRMKEPNREPVLEQGAIHTIEHLADLYLDLIRADQELEADGSGITVVQTNKAGAEYRCLNPILEAKYTILRECRNYEAKLGLTPADHRKIMSERNEQPESTLGAALRMLSS